MRLFRTGSPDVVKECQVNFSFLPIRSQLCIRTARFLQQFAAKENSLCLLFAHIIREFNPGIVFSIPGSRDWRPPIPGSRDYIMHTSEVQMLRVINVRLLIYSPSCIVFSSQLHNICLHAALSSSGRLEFWLLSTVLQASPDVLSRSRSVTVCTVHGGP